MRSDIKPATVSPTLVPYTNPAKVDREFLDLHGIPYSGNTPKGSKPTDSKPHQTGCV